MLSRTLFKSSLSPKPSPLQRLQAVSSHISNMVFASSTQASSAPIVSFIGGGNMAEAILGGLHASGHPGSRLKYSEPWDERRKYMQTQYPEFVGSSSNDDVVIGADVVILAVKPQMLRGVLEKLAPTLQGNTSTVLISIAAGITIENMQKWLGDSAGKVPIVRCMPNTPCLVGEGAAGLYATKNVSDEQKSLAEGIMQAVAKEVSWLKEESLIDSVTGISGSGPAYFFLIMEAMEQAGIDAGLSPENAKALTLQTCLGAARMAQNSKDDLATLRRKVTSPKGTTEAAIKSLEANGIRATMKDAVFAAAERGRQLSDELGKELDKC